MILRSSRACLVGFFTLGFVLSAIFGPVSPVRGATLSWNGTAGGNWETGPSLNWLSGTTALPFTNGAAVQFDDALAGTAAVRVSVPVQPAGILISNLNANYIFSGPAAVQSIGLFTKAGNGQAVWGVTGPNLLASAGNAVVSAGTLVLDGSNGQTNSVAGELWIGNLLTSTASLVLTNTVLTNNSIAIVGRGNGTSGLRSSLWLYNATFTCTNLSLGQSAGVTGSKQSPLLVLNSSSRLFNNGGTGTIIGENNGSTASVEINGTAALYSANRIVLGNQSTATGTVTIAESGALTNGGWASAGAGGAGIINLRDNAIWKANGDFNVADTTGSRGLFNIQDNAQLLAATLYVGKAANSTGIVNQAGGTVVRSSGGEWRIGGNVASGANQVGIYNLYGGVLNVGSGNLQIGAYGNGTLTQTGGVVSVSGVTTVGRFAGSTGYLNIFGGTLNQGSSQNLVVGDLGTGWLVVSNTGMLNCGARLVIGGSSGGSGTVILSGGTLTTRGVQRGNAGAFGTFLFDGGLLQAAPGADSNFLGGLNDAVVSAKGALIDSGTNTITIAQNLSNGGGKASLTKRGIGKLSLTGSLGYIGPTTVEAGILEVTAPQNYSSAVWQLANGSGFGVRMMQPNATATIIGAEFGTGGATSLELSYGTNANPVNPTLNVTGSLAIRGPVLVSISGTGLQTGRIPLVQYGSITGSGYFILGKLPIGMVASLTTNALANRLELEVTTGAAGVDWQMKQAPLMTDWAQQVDPVHPWPEYPRPQMQRTNWLNLNGVWQWQPGASGDPLPSARLTNSILVPFCMESALSGVMARYERAWYQRTFAVPADWSGQRVLLHFEAVDWECEPYLDGVSLGVHRGGYDPFSFEITPFLTNSGPHTLVVRVYDPTDAATAPVLLPIGKQRMGPAGIWYTSCSGIWQTVWLEPVPATSIESLHLVPNIDSQQLKVDVGVSGPTTGLTVSATAYDGAQVVSTVSGAPGTSLLLSVPNPKLWHPTNAFLYDLRVELSRSTGVVDQAASYFGMRKISLGTNNGIVKLFLNNQFLFQFGPLDQGFWPDGIYTPPTDLAMREDIEQTKALGFNLIRKHVKVEPRRWYYHADHLGVLVWQDMPSMLDNKSETNVDTASRTNFETELGRLVTNHWNAPSIIAWTVFNEGWGQYDTVRLTTQVKAMDPSRLVNCASGWNFYETGDMEDSHSYPNPSCPQNDARAVVNGEFGGVGLGITNHTWAAGWGYVGATNGLDLTVRFEDFCSQLGNYVQNQGLSAAVYTQITDVETELNGLYTYDRKVFKPLLSRMQQAIVVPLATYQTTAVVPTSQGSGQIWKYTTSSPAANWYSSGFNDSAWTTGPGGFGTAGTPGSVVRTTWSTTDIWLRRTFDPGTLTTQQLTNLVFNVHHDEDVQIYVNGILAASATGYTTAYNTLPANPTALASIVPGPNNVLAVHCHQTGGGQYIDAGLELRTVITQPPTPPVPHWVEDGTGLGAEYFSDSVLQNRATVQIDATLNFDWGSGTPATGVPADFFSARWNGQIQPRYSEVYTFHLTANDGCRLWIGDQLLINKWSEDTGSDATGSIVLTGGERYNLKVEYFDHVGPASIKLEWASASQAREVVPQGVLFPNRPPSLASIADSAVLAGQTVAFTASASDPDSGQTVHYALQDSPEGAGIDTISGAFYWRPTIAQSPGNYAITVLASDDGAPSLSVARTFHVNVTRPPAPGMGATRIAAGQLQFTVSGSAGPDYQIYSTTNLTAGPWLLIQTTNPAALPFLFSEPLDNQSPGRFYRVQLGP